MAEVGPAEFVRRLVTGGAIEGVRGPVSRKAGSSAPRVAYLRDLAPRLVSEFLAKSGGWRKRDVVVGGKEFVHPNAQRIWSKDVWDRGDFKLSQPSWELMARVVEWRAGAGAGGALDGGIARGLVPSTMGDIVWFHLVIDPLVSVVARPTSGGLEGDGEDESSDDEDEDEEEERPSRRKPKARPPRRGRGAAAPDADADAEATGDREAAVDALLAASPLTALYRGDAFRADYGDGHDDSEAWESAVVAARRRLAPLVAKERALVLTYLDDAVARAWLEAEPARRSAGLDEARMRYASLAATIWGLLAACVDAKRLDAMRPAMRFFERYAVRFGRQQEIVPFFQTRAAELSQSHMGRQSYTRCVSLLFGAVGEINEEAEDVKGEPASLRTASQKAFIKAFGGDGDIDARGLDDLATDYEDVRAALADEIGA